MILEKEKIAETLCSSLCAEVKVLERNGQLLISTPFHFPDGDPYILYLRELPGGLIRVTDAGHTMMFLSYENDVDKIFAGNRNRLLDRILSTSDVELSDGEFFVDVLPSEISNATFRLSQAITSLSDITFLNRSRTESTFYEDLEDALIKIVPGIEVFSDYIVPDTPDASAYKIDYRIEGKQADLFIFGIPTKDKIRLTTITLGHLLRHQFEFESISVFQDQASLAPSDLARLSNVGGEMVSSLAAIDDLTRKVRKRVAHAVSQG